jgi:putative oxidoreductase
MKRTVLVWVPQIVAAALFLLAGSSKLAGAPMQVDLFRAIGLGQWFRYLTGALEVGGAAGLFVPALAPFAALVLAAVMVGAVLTHLFIIGGNPLPAMVLFALTLTIVWLRRERTSTVLATV